MTQSTPKKKNMIEEIRKNLLGSVIRKGLRIRDFTYKDGDTYGKVETNQGLFQVLSHVFLDAEDPEEAADNVRDEVAETDSEMNNPTYRGR